MIYYPNTPMRYKTSSPHCHNFNITMGLLFKNQRIGCPKSLIHSRKSTRPLVISSPTFVVTMGEDPLPLLIMLLTTPFLIWLLAVHCLFHDAVFWVCLTSVKMAKMLLCLCNCLTCLYTLCSPTHTPSVVPLPFSPPGLSDPSVMADTPSWPLLDLHVKSGPASPPSNSLCSLHPDCCPIKDISHLCLLSLLLPEWGQPHTQ